MANPVAGLGQASAKIVEEIQKQAQQQVQQQQVQPNKFNDVMQAQQVQGTQGPQQVNNVRQVEAPNKAIETLQAAKLNSTDASLGVKTVDASKETTGKGFKKMLSGIVDGQNKLDEIIKMATSGKHFGQQELLAIQAGVYKYSQELELTSKVVEKATSGVKQTMQTQV